MASASTPLTNTRKKMECHIRSYVPDRCMGHRHKFPVMIGA